MIDNLTLQIQPRWNRFKCWSGWHQWGNPQYYKLPLPGSRYMDVIVMICLRCEEVKGA